MTTYQHIHINLPAPTSTYLPTYVFLPTNTNPCQPTYLPVPLPKYQYIIAADLGVGISLVNLNCVISLH